VYSQTEKLGINCLPTKYEEGFKYIDEKGCSCTLIEFVKIDSKIGEREYYRWKIKIEVKEIDYSAEAWTDDHWIDLCLGKAYYDEINHKIIYFDKTLQGCI